MMLKKKAANKRSLVERTLTNFSASFVIVIFVILLNIQGGDTISCYTCSSWNYTDRDCHDPYNPANSKYTRDCMVPKKGHIGQFPAYFCLKIIGRKEVTGEALVIRACIMENMDNQCGMFRYQEGYFQGCILTCDYNGCNDADALRSTTRTTAAAVFIVASITAIVFGRSGA